MEWQEQERAKKDVASWLRPLRSVGTQQFAHHVLVKRRRLPLILDFMRLRTRLCARGQREVDKVSLRDRRSLQFAQRQRRLIFRPLFDRLRVDGASEGCSMNWLIEVNDIISRCISG